ncbi:conserved hypothetical protein [Myxococcus xanthus DK 1622]|uniref:Uncharacterized protein n=1 Tax=Myxococcus xanthus (strain DK1622) TaxID=246197 RepID=Q1DBG8_MYXXD|nr:conserved hypothetical protein [Myxococcus xanthus DK 1622]QZZ49278.1 hypothetical protein MyxoNM_08710 [Myxococcus xanthus]SDY21220.1 hypothetical protein SAMN05444383_12440 [Myxococcus xanthus]
MGTAGHSSTPGGMRAHLNDNGKRSASRRIRGAQDMIDFCELNNIKPGIESPMTGINEAWPKAVGKKAR